MPAAFGPMPAPAVNVPSLAGAPVQSDPPRTVIWNLPLQEALRIAMRNSDVVRLLDDGGVHSGQTSYDAAIACQRTNAALAAFDVSLAASFFFNRINEPPDSFFGPGLSEPIRRDEGGFNAGLTKSWPLGTETKITYNPPVGYYYFPFGDTGSLNPTYNSNVEFALRQPLLRGAGVDFNTAPITIAQLRGSQSAWDFKAGLLGMVRSIEEAYWDLQAALIAQRAIEEELPLAEEVVRIEQAQLEVQRAARAEVAKALTEYYGFRQRAVEARSVAIQRELRLRNLLGLEPADGRIVIPVTQPGRAMVCLDTACTVAAALDNRPDVIQQRLSTRLREVELMVARNGLRPQLDLLGLYRTSGIGMQLDESLNMMADNNYNDWQAGVTFSVPLGRRAASANMRAAEMQLQKEHAVLRQVVHLAAHQLADIIRQLEYSYLQCQEADQRYRASDDWLQGAQARYKSPPPAGEGQNWLLQALDDYLRAMRARAEALTDAAALLAQYNTQLARLEEAKGTLLTCYDIQMVNDPCARVSLRRDSALKVEDLAAGVAPAQQSAIPIMPGQPSLPTADPATSAAQATAEPSASVANTASAAPEPFRRLPPP